MAPLVQALQDDPTSEAVVAVTAQHREMLDQVLRLFGIEPDFDLNLMKPGQSLTELTSRILTGLAPVIDQVQPDWVLVQGDTTTAFAGALAAFYAHKPVAHVEAGLRTGDLWVPYPEEGNRRLVARLAALHFAPTRRAAENLWREGTPRADVFITGNTVVDALLWVVRGHGSSPSWQPTESPDVRPEQSATSPSAGHEPWTAHPGRMILVTTHRRENWGEPLSRIYGAILDVLESVPDAWVLFPCHRNPLVRKRAQAVLGGHPRVEIIEPLDYVDFIHALEASTLVLSDSGGVQEEAPALRKPVLVLRDETERIEAVEAGTARLVGTQRDRIAREAIRLLTDPGAYAAMASAGGESNPFGDGQASRRIVAVLKERSRAQQRSTEQSKVGV
ncbi:MAG: UDP-N-acetylglucosamine 2-epimerase (non-hydrolyzing) [Limnochordaceae bacterium]|nr:UDP-N-acetylglucosamine 2-epimerase (non-hydrolyzing) [Limnochordaceae bacterium]